MIDSPCVKAHAAAAKTLAAQKGLNSKLHLVADEYGIPANGTVADCSQAPLLAEDLKTKAFRADKAYDTNELLNMLEEADINAVIPRLKAGKSKERTTMNCIGVGTPMKMSSAPQAPAGTAARCAKLTVSFIAAIHVTHICKARRGRGVPAFPPVFRAPQAGKNASEPAP